MKYFNTYNIILLSFALFFILLGNSSADVLNRGFLIPHDSSSYKIYSYPEGDSKFSIPYKFNLKFTIKNGKYFYLNSEDIIGKLDCNFDILFLSPEGEKIKKINVRRLTESYEIPQNEKSINAEYLDVIILNNHRQFSRNFKFVVASDINPVHGEIQKEKL